MHLTLLHLTLHHAQPRGKMKISRKAFFKGLAFGTLALPGVLRLLGWRGQAQQSSGPNIITRKRYQWKMVTTWPPNFPILQEGCEQLAQWIHEMTDGQLHIQVFAGGELVPPLEIFDAVRNGVAEMGSGAAYYWAGKIPAAQFFASVPFGMNAQQLNSWLLAGQGLELWRELYSHYDLVPFPAGNTGVQMGGWFNKEINSVHDLKGLKMRIPGLGGKVLEKAGGSPVLLAGSELYTGLERGVIDATEWLSPFHDYKMGFHQIARYYYTPGWHEPGTTLELIVSKTHYDQLPTHLQAIITAAASRLNEWTLAAMEAANGIYLEKIKAVKGLQIRSFSDEVLQELKKYTVTVIEELTQNDPFAQRVYQSYHAFRQKATAWADLSEHQYYERLSTPPTTVQ